MRITNNSIKRNYTQNLNRNLELLNKANTKVAADGRKIFKMSDDTATGVRAMTVRRNLARIDGYIDNAKNAKSVLAGSEKIMLKISDITKDISDKYQQAITGTSGPDERDIIATELTKLRDEILNCANGKFSDRFLFGGTNTETPPFTVDDNGELFYNGVKVSDIDKTDPQYDYLFNDASYIDLGLGMTMQANPSDQNVVSSTAYKNSTVGLDFVGSGEDNIYNTINKLIDSLKDTTFDVATCEKLFAKFKSEANTVGIELTKLGSDDAYLDFSISRLENESDVLIERQDSLEFDDPVEAIMDFEMQQYVYNAALQMGQRLLQPTLFDFVK